MSNIKQEIVSSFIFQKVTARLHQRRRRHQLKAMCSEIIEKYQDQKPLSGKGKCSDYIWLCWWQGEASMGPLVRECYARIKRFNPDKQVILITEENIFQYYRVYDGNGNMTVSYSENDNTNTLSFWH